MMVCFIIAAFMIFGNIIVNASFQSALDRETKRSIEEMKIFRYALMASLEGLPTEYRASDMAIVEITKSIKKSLENNNSIIIYNNQKEIIYNNDKSESGLIEQKQKKNHGIWMITEHTGRHYTECFFEVKSRLGTYYLELGRDIEFLYEDRNGLYKNYQATLLVVFIISAVISFLFSMSFTNPIRKLSIAARDFATGNYTRRVKEKGNDEVSVLIMEFNRMAEQLENNIHELEENARQQEEFTEAFSHELKTPLTSIIGYADMLRSQKLSEEDILLSSDYIFKQGKRLERLALKMMELSFVNKQEIERKPVTVKNLADRIEKSVSKILENSQIDFIVDVEDGLLNGDIDLLESLFFNLIDNARKACSENGIIVLEGKDSEKEYSFHVTDNGCGIPPHEIKKITEAFYMVDKSRSRKEGGAGIGLALCMKIIQKHDALLQISSQPGEGTQVTVAFKHSDTSAKNQKSQKMNCMEV